MPDKVGFFDDVFEQGGQIASQAGKQLDPKTAVTSALNQVAPGLTPPANGEDSPDNKKLQQKPLAQKVVSAPKSFIKAAAGQIAPATEDSPDVKKPISQPKSVSDLITQQLKPENPQEASREQADLAKVRQELHSNYYQNLVNRPKPKEEKPAERVEREEKEEEEKKFLKKQEDDKKALPINVKQGTGEKITGIGG